MAECHWRFGEQGTVRFPAFNDVERAGERHVNGGRENPRPR